MLRNYKYFHKIAENFSNVKEITIIQQGISDLGLSDLKGGSSSPTGMNARMISPGSSPGRTARPSLPFLERLVLNENEIKTLEGIERLNPRLVGGKQVAPPRKEGTNESWGSSWEVGGGWCQSQSSEIILQRTDLIVHRHAVLHCLSDSARGDIDVL